MEFVLTDAYVEINGVDLSDHVTSVTINYGAELPQKTAMGDLNHTRLPGLLDWSMEFELNQDFDAASVDDTLFPLVGAAAFPVKVRGQASSPVSATNPSFEGSGLLESYQPIAGSIGEVLATNPTIQAGSTVLSRVTA